MVVCFFVGYIIFDSFPMLYYSKSWGSVTPYVIHHSLSFISFFDCAVNGTAHNLVIALLLCEGTAPFVNGRWFLHQHGMKDSSARSSVSKSAVAQQQPICLPYSPLA